MSVSCLATVQRIPYRQSSDQSSVNGRWLTLQVKSGWMQAEGIFAGDMLRVDPAEAPGAGQLLVLSFEDRMILRRLEIGQHCLYLHPLHHQTQMLEWPFHEPLPLVGVVRQIIRKL